MKSEKKKGGRRKEVNIYRILDSDVKVEVKYYNNGFEDGISATLVELDWWTCFPVKKDMNIHDEITKTFEKLGKDNIGSESFHEFIKKKIRKQKKVEISENIEESQRRELVVFEMPDGETYLGM
tara:strand:- start:495 stop:866 length:372 start_codon:yes stop_codon:yes gene_type:complete